MDRQRRIAIVFVILTIIFTFFGSTLAYLNWQTSEEQKTNIVFKLEQDFWCAADGGGDITQDDVDIAPVSCINSEHAIKRQVVVTPTIHRNDLSITTELFLDINNMGIGFSNSDNFKYALTTNSNSCTEGVISSGTFKGTRAGDQVRILSQNYSSSTPQTYYLYIWLDAVETSPTTMRQQFSLSMSGDCFDEVKPEQPVIDEGMIPVTLSSNGTVKTIQPGDPNWYDYDNKEWANVVLVDDDSRSTYQDTSGVTVEQSDILAYYVWIPRYRYRISSGTGPREIDIEFESATSKMKMGDAINTYRTHPAFWWDDDSDGTADLGETIPGIWVGKYETSTNTNGTCYTSESLINCAASNVSPRIVPNVKSLRHQNVSAQFTTSRKFSENGNIYGLSNTSTNAHMMKNSEWGAISYLSYSKYGINDAIRKNNNSNFITGCGALVENGGNTTSCEISYNSGLTPQSTTGNITGIFDMVGGAWDYVMTGMVDKNGNFRSGDAIGSNSGFNGMLRDGTLYTEGIDLPALKYYDLYTTEDWLTSCDGDPCYGHGSFEMDEFLVRESVLYFSWPWLARGGRYYDDASIFSLYNFGGAAYYSYSSWHSVIVVGFGP